jgi:hypothetical protein
VNSKVERFSFPAKLAGLRPFSPEAASVVIFASYPLDSQFVVFEKKCPWSFYG